MIAFRYRPDIDGLRAVAVALVILFHAQLGFPGGYVGVDVFFVISGFLITGLIVKDQKASKFSLSAFWARRIRRIMPAATAMAMITLAAGCFLMIPSDLADLAESTIAQQFMVANFYFWQNLGYFDGAAETKPMLHTWSLAIEEQFYVFFPFLLVMIRPLSDGYKLAICLVSILASLAMSEWGVRSFPSAAFFLLPTRMWELLLGAAIVFCPAPNDRHHRTLEVLSWFGFVLIVVSAVSFDGSTAFPGLAALVPCVATALIIYANASRPTSLARILSIRCIVLIGLLSYSLYLWHWPLLAFCRHWQGEELLLQTRLIALGASFFVAYLSWRYVETPFRQGFRDTGIAKLSIAAVVSASLSAGIAVYIIRSEGLPQRLPGSALAYLDYRKTYLTAEVSLSEIIDGKLPVMGTKSDDFGEIDFIVWGDSHAGVFVNTINESCADHQLTGAMLSKGALPPLVGITNSRHGTNGLRHNDAILTYMDTKQIQSAILVASWSLYVGYSDAHRIRDGMSEQAYDDSIVLRTGLERTLNELKQRDIDVWLVKQVPDQRADPRLKLVHAAFFGKPTPKGITLEEYRRAHEKANSIIDEVAKTYENVSMVDPAHCCFDENGFSHIGDESGTFYRDHGHLSDLGASELMGPVFQQIFECIGGKKSSLPAVN